jgi:hypothetical protein
MSLAVLHDVYTELRRVAIAGSVVGPGDFRLKKLIPQLEQLGAKAPVFAKVGEAVKAVVDGKDKESASALLELATLVNAILHTQGETGASGDLAPIETINLGLTGTQTSARTLKPVLEAITTTGSGRLELIKDAHERGQFRDLRLVKPAIGAWMIRTRRLPSSSRRRSCRLVARRFSRNCGRSLKSKAGPGIRADCT